MSFGTNDINSIIDCSEDNELRNENDDVETSEDIVNQILNELGNDDNDNDNENINLDHNYDNNYDYDNNNDNDKFNTRELNAVSFNNINNEHNNMNHNQHQNNINHTQHQNNYNDNSMFSNRFNDDISFKEHMQKKTDVNKKKNDNIIKKEDSNDSWCSLIPGDMLSNLSLYKNYILILIISLITNNPLVYKQMINISIFNTDNKLNIFAYLFQSLLFIILYLIINFISSFI